MSKIIQPDSLHEGAEARVSRLMPTARLAAIDPFVFFDHFHAGAGAGFPDHPHRGFEAVTLLLSGELRHADSLGNDAMLQAGEAQAFTAGRGMVHSEMVGFDQEAEGLQLWVNLPRSLKGLDPAYQPPVAPREAAGEGYVLRLVSGEGAPIQLRTPNFIALLDMAPGARFALGVPPEWRGFAYVLRGDVEVSGFAPASSGEGVTLGGDDTLSSHGGARVFVALGQAHGEPIVMRGPYVD